MPDNPRAPDRIPCDLALLIVCVAWPALLIRGIVLERRGRRPPARKP